jgi:hypothetical protein
MDETLQNYCVPTSLFDWEQCPTRRLASGSCSSSVLIHNSLRYGMHFHPTASVKPTWHVFRFNLLKHSLESLNRSQNSEGLSFINKKDTTEVWEGIHQCCLVFGMSESEMIIEPLCHPRSALIVLRNNYSISVNSRISATKVFVEWRSTSGTSALSEQRIQGMTTTLLINLLHICLLIGC